VYFDIEIAGETENSTVVKSSLGVFSANGTEMSRSSDDDVPTFNPLHDGCSVLVYSEDGRPTLFDAATGELMTIQLPEDFDGTL